MSHPSKVELFQQAKDLGFFAFLYFVATRDPQVNIDRVALRVKQGGHDVPPDRIVARYLRTMAMLPKAIEIADCAYIYDNSQLSLGSGADGLRFVAKIENGSRLGRVDTMFAPTPYWVRKALETLKGN